MKMRKKLEQWIPGYARWPLICLVLVNCIAYYGSRLLVRGAARYDLSTALDARLPFWPVFIVFYILAYAQWFFGYIIIAREDREICRRVLGAEMIAKLICLVCFVALPTRMVRPEVTGNGVFERLTALIYSLDAPINLFPSIHCLDSWMCFRGAQKLKRTPRWYALFMLALTLPVLASTVLVKQHVLVDIPAGILAGEIGLFLMRGARRGRGRGEAGKGAGA